MSAKLLPLDEFIPSTYNPRDTDPKRLDFIELSLRKLGFLLPLYRERDGEALSGHQRHLVASRMGATHVPVETLYPDKKLDLNMRKGINILFNRATNDFSFEDTPRKATEKLETSGILEEIEKLPDIPVNSPEFYPCINQVQPVDLHELMKANDFKNANDARNMAAALKNKGVMMPVVVDPDLKIINGKGRALLLAEEDSKTVPVVMVSHERAKAAYHLINLISMEFNLHERYADVLRYNSFSRKRNSRETLGRGFIFMISNESSNKFDINIPENKQNWISTYGKTVLNFGAGHMTESEILRRNGVYVTSFEPYVLSDHDEIDKQKSLDVCRMFLRDVAARKVWDSIFINQVFNSVPFAEDRLHIVNLLAALSTNKTKVYARATSDQAGNSPWLKGKRLNKTAQKSSTMIVEYEKGITVGDFSKGKPKMQKFHDLEEFRALLSSVFRQVDADYDAGDRGQVKGIAQGVRQLNLNRLKKAIEFEFDLPYPDGSKMNLADEAKSAFSKRLGVKL